MPGPFIDLLVEWGPFGGLAIFIVVSMMRGWLVPGKEMRQWRKAFFEEQEQKRALMQAGLVTQQVLQALPEVIEHEERFS